MVHYLSTVAGDQNQYIYEALRAFQFFEFESFSAISIQKLELRLMEMFCSLYPQKVSYLGEPTVQHPITLGMDKMESLGIDDIAGKSIIITHQFLFGVGVTQDPMYPWIATLLNDTSRTSIFRTREILGLTRKFVNEVCLPDE